MDLIRRVIGGLSAVVLLAFSATAVQAAEIDAGTYRWAQQVLLGPEFGGGGKVCSRWVTSPTVSVFWGTAEHRKVMAETVAQLNKTLAKTSIKKITLLAPNSANANIRVYFAPIEHFPRVAKFHGFRYVQGNWGYFWTFWNRRNEINRAYVLLATDKLKGASLRHFALEELTQSLGLSNDSSQFRDSIFYSGRDGGGTAQQLSPADRRLIIFFYNHVRPGTKGDELRALLRRHW